jgi:hypothetical protein
MASCSQEEVAQSPLMIDDGFFSGVGRLYANDMQG